MLVSQDAIVVTTFMKAPASTKMPQSRLTWEGRGTCGTPANVSDVAEARLRRRSSDEDSWADSGYTGVVRKPEATRIDLTREVYQACAPELSAPSMW